MTHLETGNQAKTCPSVRIHCLIKRLRYNHSLQVPKGVQVQWWMSDFMTDVTGQSIPIEKTHVQT